MDIGHAIRTRTARGAAALMVAIWLLVALASVVVASQLPPATSTGWSVVIVNNYSPCNGPVAPGNCHGSAVVTTTGAPPRATPQAVVVGGSPFGTVITPDGSLALILNIVEGTLSPINLTQRPPQVLPAVHIGGRGDSFIAIAPDGRTALVADTGSSNVYPVRIAGHTFRVGRRIDVGGRPGQIAVSADGSTAWVVIPGQGAIRPINVGDGSFAVGKALAAGAVPGAIALSTNGSTAYVTSTARNTVTSVPLVGGGADQTIAVGAAPLNAVITADGSAMYVTNGGRGTVTPIDLSGGTMRAQTPFVVPHGSSDAIAFPSAEAISPDGKQLWVTDGGNLVGGPAQSGNTATVFDIQSPMKPVVIRTIATGGFEVRAIAITPPRIDFGSGPSTLALSLPTLGDVLGAQVLIAGAAVAAGSVLFITFPSQIFNLTLQENYPLIAAWIADRRKRLRSLRAWFGGSSRQRDLATGESSISNAVDSIDWRGELPAFAVVIALGALLGALLDPRFGPDWRGVASYIAIAFAIPAVATITALCTWLCYRSEYQRPRAHLRALPIGLAVAAICVIISRVVDFQPGYLYGVVCGIAFEGVLLKLAAGRVTMLGSLAVLAVCVVAWLAWKPVGNAASAPNAFFGLVVVDDFLASLTVGGIVGSAIGLLPLRFLPGAVIREWSFGAWAATFGLAMILLISIVVRSPLAPVSHSALWVVVALFVLFAGVSVGFREYFARRWRRDHGVVVHGLGNRVRDLLVPRPVARAQDAPVDRPTITP